MYIQKIIYDSSCNFRNNKFYPSVHVSALFDLTKDYIYVIDKDIYTVDADDESYDLNSTELLNY